MTSIQKGGKSTRYHLINYRDFREKMENKAEKQPALFAILFSFEMLFNFLSRADCLSITTAAGNRKKF